jgi:sulfate adenylyltransferase
VLVLSGTDLRRRLADGREIPQWFTFPEVAEELRRTYPSRDRAGFTLFFTGLSGSGKSTLANVLLVKLLELGTRPVTLLDGDIVRKVLSSELGFSKEHRDLNIRRIGFVAAEITKNRGIAPVRADRTLRRRAPRSAPDDRASGRFHPRASVDTAGYLRTARSKGPLRKGTRRID